MKKALSIVLTLLFIMVLSAGCNSQSATQSATTNKEFKLGELTDAKTMVVNKDKKEIQILAEVNGKYLTESTRHGVVFKDGTNGEKSVLRGLANQFDFYNALIEIGAKPGNNISLDDMKKAEKSVEGSKLNVFVTWNGLGKEIPFSDILKATEKRPMDIRFGGNLENATNLKTGCILCLDSCAVGIASDAAFKANELEIKKQVKITGNPDVLPKDGTKVAVIFRLAD
ncbi:YdjY domain-containing protein [Pelotomaculum isophthalicicum JI]|uniref:YdjY domain-containing protein n=1 Tax=Pelotomaculum isophthalicicum JI TaxID=947010 RepID=A0A9X4H401_9FIRM|nr:YdjY domain-containing protein [Pelotomaculum isophthalicicum]MDF9409996.1 YdjY domain-containing protein [Pelotomaculum isophthalicicum JI]